MICNLHQVDYALEFGERIVGLSGGQVIFDGAPDKLTVDIIHRIYPGLDDPGIERAAARRSADQATSLCRRSRAVAHA